jgi:hypothetical protein
MIMFRVGAWVRIRLTGHCGHFHAPDADGRIGLISGVVTDQMLAIDNALAADPRDILTRKDFGDHIYSVDFTGPDSPDAELYSVREMEPLPAWARKHLAASRRRHSGPRSLP